MSFKVSITKFYYDDIMGFGENLHKELVFQDIQIKELAARTGIKKSTLDKYLSGNKSQQYDKLSEFNRQTVQDLTQSLLKRQ